MKDERFIVTYRIEASSYEDAKAIAWAIQVEQTIEFPYEFVTDPYIKENITSQPSQVRLKGVGEVILSEFIKYQ